MSAAINRVRAWLARTAVGDVARVHGAPAVAVDTGDVAALLADYDAQRTRATAAEAELARLREALDAAANRIENLEITRTIGPAFDDTMRALERERCAGLCDAAAARWSAKAPGEVVSEGDRWKRANEAAALAAEIRGRPWPQVTP